MRSLNTIHTFQREATKAYTARHAQFAIALLLYTGGMTKTAPEPKSYGVDNPLIQERISRHVKSCLRTAGGKR